MEAWIENLAIGWLLLIFVAGVGFLVFGGDGLCRGAVHIAREFNVPSVIVGLTVVSIATSLPELFTSLFGALRGSDGLAVGNVMGSNIGNIGLILALAALMCPLTVRSRLVRRDVPILIVVTALFILLAWDGLARWEGALLFAICLGYLYYMVRVAREGKADLTAEVEDEVRSIWGGVFWVAVGAVLLAAGAELLVRSAAEIARDLGVAEVAVGITVVAIGTSLPELAASVAAAARKQVDLCAGNIIGSNLFNLVLVSGAVPLISPLDVEVSLFSWEMPILMALTLLLWPFFLTGKVVSRLEGGILLLLYAAFLAVTIWLRVL